MRNYEISSASPIESTLIRNFIRDAQARLAQLQAQKERIYSRMQALRYLFAHAEAANRHCEAQSTPASRRFLRIELVPKVVRQTPRQPRLFDNQSKLRRACRIALLESDQPQSSAEIYERIQKRGSMSFDEGENVSQMLTAQLKTMTENSEILCQILNGEMRWQWKPAQENLP